MRKINERKKKKGLLYTIWYKAKSALEHDPRSIKRWLSSMLCCKYKLVGQVLTAALFENKIQVHRGLTKGTILANKSETDSIDNVQS